MPTTEDRSLVAATLVAVADDAAQLALWARLIVKRRSELAARLDLPASTVDEAKSLLGCSFESLDDAELVAFAEDMEDTRTALLRAC